MSDAETAAALVPISGGSQTIDDCEVEVLDPDDVDQPDDEQQSDQNSTVVLSHNERLEHASQLADKGCVQLDLVNFTLVRCEQGSQGGRQQYRLMAAPNTEEGGSDDLLAGNTVCLLEEQAAEAEVRGRHPRADAERGPLVIMEYADGDDQVQTTAAALLAHVIHSNRIAKEPAKRRRWVLPPPHEMLSSPNFKLYLYTCRLCSFRCNAIRELTAHKKQSHMGRPAARWRGAPPARAPPVALQCARCPHRASSHLQLLQHTAEAHPEPDLKPEPAAPGKRPAETTLTNSADAASGGANPLGMDILVCGACGYEASDRDVFRRHILRHKRQRKLATSTLPATQ